MQQLGNTYSKNIFYCLSDAPSSFLYFMWQPYYQVFVETQLYLQFCLSSPLIPVIHFIVPQNYRDKASRVTSERGWGHQPCMQIVISLSTQSAAPETPACSYSWSLCSQLPREIQCLCAAFVTFILSSRNGQNTCPENDLVLYFSHCCASNCLVYFYSLLHGILERQRDYMDSKSHYLSTCIHTSHLELFIQPPENKQTNNTYLKNYFREFISSDYTSFRC